MKELLVDGCLLLCWLPALLGGLLLIGLLLAVAVIVGSLLRRSFLHSAVAVVVLQLLLLHGLLQVFVSRGVGGV